ncbi:WD40 repeat domain-containing serine/threonine protein kinase [Ktedonospora formicarum]|uniref:non-specific serine/threonine protein kinase n=1 Tax=Ktedonospora formicarum TaxID=2778364 RepID=A0A8J3IC85_9CHLR|nr:serine/threonine-protein kinase [Ktedonospora formicarum]GHO49444.1 hypothetical protein KSX_76070 [Ktedonospora formicarum]
MEQQQRIGQQLGNYRLGRMLGRGGFAEVYLADHVHLNTQVAVKILSTRLTEDDVQEFRREAQLLASLVHPRIVRVLDFGVEDGSPYLVMDYAPNGTLRRAHPKGSRLPIESVVTLTRQVAEALQYAHDKRLIHRDVKPENILLGRDNEILLSDFGIALAFQSSHLQSTQNIAGTIAYMAPEQIQAHPVPASDQYALGTVVYEWLCGQRPFNGTYTEVAIKQSTVFPPAPSSLRSDLGPAFEQVVLRALHKDPQQRFPRILDFALALEQAAQQADSQLFIPTERRVNPPSLPGNYAPTPSSTSLSSLSTPGQYTPSTNPPAYVSGQAPSPYIPYGMPTPGTYVAPPAPKRRGRRSLLIGCAVGLVAVCAPTSWFAVTQGPKLARNVLNSAGGVTGLALPLLSYKGHKDYAYVVGWSPDGKYIASSSNEGTLLLWSADKGETRLSVRSLVQPPESDDYAWSLAWTAHPTQRLAAGFVDGTIQILDPNAGKRLLALDRQEGGVIPVLSWSPDGRYLAIVGSDDRARVYSYEPWKVVRTYGEHTDDVSSIAWSPDGKWLVTGSKDTTARIWEPLTGHTKMVYKGHASEVSSLSWSPDSKQIVSVERNQSAKIWEAATGTTRYTYQAPGGAPIGDAYWSNHGKYVSIYGGDAQLSLYDTHSGKIEKNIPTGVSFNHSWSPDDTRIVSASGEKTVDIWEVN